MLMSRLVWLDIDPSIPSAMYCRFPPQCLTVSMHFFSQICVYKYQNGGGHKKPIVGTVHVALNYLTTQKSQNINQNLACDGDWFKVSMYYVLCCVYCALYTVAYRKSALYVARQ